MSKTIACVIARTVSTRLPLKVLRVIYEQYTMLDFIIQRLKLTNDIDGIYICTSNESVDDILEDVALKNKVNIYRGSPDSVIERLIGVGEEERAENVIRITGDNVFTSYEYIDKMVEIHNNNGLDYTRLIEVPCGVTPEVIRLSALRKCCAQIDPSTSEYLMLYLFMPDIYKCGVIKLNETEDYCYYNLTVDYPYDLERTREIIRHYTGDKLKIKLLEILNIMNEYSVSNSIINFDPQVKLPYGKTMKYKDFIFDLKQRAEISHRFVM